MICLDPIENAVNEYKGMLSEGYYMKYWPTFGLPRMVRDPTYQYWTEEQIKDTVNSLHKIYSDLALTEQHAEQKRRAERADKFIKLHDLNVLIYLYLQKESVRKISA